jgi:(p)ppGpp synthase/HD superfamily hydrolase
MTNEQADPAYRVERALNSPGAIAALRLARRMHDGQLDEAGQPCIEHCLRVARQVAALPGATDAEVQVAILHHVLEDTYATPADLAVPGIQAEAIAIMRALTRPAGVAYLDWIRQLAANGDRSVIRVKLADLDEIIEHARGDPERERLIWLRYEPARRILAQACGTASAPRQQGPGAG